MKKIKTILAILPALLFSCAGDDVEKYIPPTPIAPSEPGEEVVYHKRAKEQFDLINQCYRINSGATERVMQKIGMERVREFDHPLVPGEHPLCRHVLYHIKF